jgi:hypothetical protein
MILIAAFPYALLFFTPTAAMQPDGIMEIQWSSVCGFESKSAYTTLPVANPPQLNTPKVVSAQVEIPGPAPTNAPVIDGYPPISPPEFSTEGDLASDPGAYFSHTEVPGVDYGQGERTPQPKAGHEVSDGGVQTGSFTYFEVGRGACGQDSTGQDETGNIVSLSKVLFDAAMIDGNTNNNPLCGRTITIEGPYGKTSHGTVLDRCEGCEGSDVDVSRKMFKEILGTLDEGRIPVKWWYD